MTFVLCKLDNPSNLFITFSEVLLSDFLSTENVLRDTKPKQMRNFKQNVDKKSFPDVVSTKSCFGRSLTFMIHSFIDHKVITKGFSTITFRVRDCEKAEKARTKLIPLSAFLDFLLHLWTGRRKSIKFRFRLAHKHIVKLTKGQKRAWIVAPKRRQICQLEKCFGVKL